MLWRKINAQKLVHLKILSYLCIRKRNKQQIKPQDPEGHRDYEDYSKQHHREWNKGYRNNDWRWEGGRYNRKKKQEPLQRQHLLRGEIRRNLYQKKPRWYWDLRGNGLHPCRSSWKEITPKSIRNYEEGIQHLRHQQRWRCVHPDGDKGGQCKAYLPTAQQERRT